MCGIAGFVRPGRGGKVRPQAIAAVMAGELVHRGPDSGGVWGDADGSVGLGFRRLAILDLSPAGDQPMTSSDGRYVLVFNGEIYNFAALRRELESLGQRFRGRSDTEVILAAVLEWGVEPAVKRLRGMFACGLWDVRDRELWLFRDRIGIKPLYYGEVGGGFAFGSELKAIRAVPDFQEKLSDTAVAQYFATGYIPAPHSIYRNVWKLEPGHILHWRERTSRHEKWTYWDLGSACSRSRAANYSAGDDTVAATELEELLRRAVTRHMVADVPLGAFLSGGLDSSLVAALMQENSGRPIRTFSVGFRDLTYDEAPYAKRVAEHIGSDHTEIYVEPAEALAVIPDIPRIYDEPFADSSQIPTLLVSRAARRAVTVALTGDGGDELFGGYLRYLYGERVWQAISSLPPQFRSTVSGLLARLGHAFPRQFSAFASSYLGANAQRGDSDGVSKALWILGVSSPDEIYDRLCLLAPGSTAVLARQPAELRRPSERPIPAWLRGAAERMSFFDILTYLPDDILTKVDRASMAVSLEARVPLLDDELIEFVIGLPSALKVHGRVTKFLLRKVLYQYVPRELLERPKAGFALPVAAWLRGPLRDWCESLLPAHDGLLDDGAVGRLWQRLLSGRQENHAVLWAVLMFNGWLAEQRTPVAALAN